jgi:glycosyltransferase involved in cell wall biosynthesis
MKSILFVSAFPLNSKTAGQNYSLRLVNDLQKKFRVDVLNFSYKDHKSVHGSKELSLSGFRKFLHAIIIPFLHPFFTCRFSIRLFIFIIRKQKNYDFIYIDFSQLLIFTKLFNKNDNVYVMLHDVIVQKYKRKRSLWSSCELRWIFFTERYLLGQNEHLFVFSRKDQRILSTIYKKESKVVDFFIDQRILSSDIPAKPESFCFYGAWNRNENWEGLSWFIRNVLPFTEEHFQIIGSGLSDDKIRQLDRLSQFQIVGFVDNPYPYISSSYALIAPVFHGAGVKVKVLESLCCGIPVIGTRIAFEGIDKSLLFSAFISNGREDYLANFARAKKINDEERKFRRKINSSLYPKHKFIDCLTGDQ